MHFYRGFLDELSKIAGLENIEGVEWSTEPLKHLPRVPWQRPGGVEGYARELTMALGKARQHGKTVTFKYPKKLLGIPVGSQEVRVGPNTSLKKLRRLADELSEAEFSGKEYKPGKVKIKLPPK